MSDLNYFFDKIKELLSSFKPINITGPVKIELSFLNSNELFTSQIRDNKVLANLSLSKAQSAEQKETILKVAQLYHDQGYVFIDHDAKQVIEGIEESSQKHKQTLDFFNGKIADEDFKILRLSAYIKSEFDKRKPIDHLIEQVRSRYGDRGRTICHLYSSGYFEKYFIPLYKVLCESPDFDPKEFKRIFDKLIRDSPFAVFVSKHTSANQLEDILNDKIQKSKRYGIRTINVHGIGRENVVKIKSVIGKFYAVPEMKIQYSERNSMIDVTIYLDEKKELL